MLEQWILDRIDPLRPSPLIILRDPQRMIKKGAWVVEGWAEQHSYTVFFCTGNLGLREMVESVRDDEEARVLLVDRSRAHTRTPLFYPDLDVKAPQGNQLTLSLRDFLVQQTNDPRWPALVETRTLADLLLENLEGALQAQRHLREVDATRFTDHDLYQIILGAVLNINPYRKLSIPELRRLCIEQHEDLVSLDKTLPAEIMQALRNAIAKAPKPFCYLLERNTDDVIRAFTLAALMRQHALDYQVLLPNLDPRLHDYRDIEPDALDAAMKDQMNADPDCVLADVEKAEKFLQENPKRLAFLLGERLQLHDPARALEALKHERLSQLVRSLALFSLLADLMHAQGPIADHHREALQLLETQQDDATLLVLRRPHPEWLNLERVYRRAYKVKQLWARLAGHARRLRVKKDAELEATTFAGLWNDQGLNCMDYYLSDLERTLRVGNPVPSGDLWPDLAERWQKARQELGALEQSIREVQNLIDARFQDLYRLRYAGWIHENDAPVVFTHQFLERILKAHWDPRSGRKAVVLVFDGLRTDAWELLLRPVLEERYTLIESRTGSALLPTETHVSRKAIAAGCLPEAFASQSELKLLARWLKGWLHGGAPDLQVVKDDDTEAAGMTVRYVSDALDYIVFNFTDATLHHNAQDLAFIYNTTVQGIIQQDVRAVLRDLPADALIFVTSDHGFAEMAQETVTVPDSLVRDRTDVTYRHAPVSGGLDADDAEKVVRFDAREMGLTLPEAHLLFPRPGYILKRQKGHRPPDRYSHGGISLAECLVPMVVLGPRSSADEPPLHIERVRQAGSVSEGEELALEIIIAAAPGLTLPEHALTLSFSSEEIPLRRELFRGRRQTYTARWTPKLPEITPELQNTGRVELPVTVIVSYIDKGREQRLSASVDVIVKIEPSRLRRRVDSKLDFLMGRVPDGLKT